MTSINFYERFAVVFLTFAVFFMGFYYAYSPVQACIRKSTDITEKRLARAKKDMEDNGYSDVYYNSLKKRHSNTPYGIKMYCNKEYRW
jgi:hypothetical protein